MAIVFVRKAAPVLMLAAVMGGMTLLSGRVGMAKGRDGPLLAPGRPSSAATDGPRPGGWTHPRGGGYSIAFSPSGERLVMVTYGGRVKILNAADGEELLSHDQHLSSRMRWAGSVLFSNDGQAVASQRGERAVELWDAASGETIRQFQIPEEEFLDDKGKGFRDPIPTALSPDGCLLVVELNALGQGPDGRTKLVLFDVETGLPVHSLPLGAWDAGSPDPMPVRRAAFTPDSRFLATASLSKTITLWDPRKGKKVREFVGHKGAVTALSVSPDGRTLASCSGELLGNISNVVENEDQSIRLWNLATGRSLLTIEGDLEDLHSVVFSPDGRTLLSGGVEGKVRLWEAATGKSLCHWDIGERISQIAVSPDGQTIAVASDLGLLTLFPIDSVADRSPPPLDDQAFGRLWDDLAGEDGEQAYQAVRALSVPADDSTARISKRLHPTAIVRPAHISRLITDLDADDFDRRETAAKDLADLGAQAEPALRKALEEMPSAEVRSRIEKLLKLLDAWVVTDPDALRTLRAIWVLQRIGTPEARAVLEDLAQGAPEVRQTQEAKAALDFLDRRAAAKP